LVEIGHKTTSINIYHGAKLLMPRQVPMGGELFTRAIADAMGVGLEEAEAMKRDSLVITEAIADRLAAPPAFDGGFGAADYTAPNATQEFTQFNPFSDDVPAYSPDAEPADSLGYAPVAPLDADPLDFAPVGAMDVDPADVIAVTPVAAEPVYDPIPAPVTDDPVLTAILPMLEEFLSEVRRSIDYFRSRGGDVQEIYLTGGGAKLKGLDVFLGRSLAIPCDAYDPLKRLNTNVRKVAPTFIDEHRNEFAIAIGNGLHIFFD
jgi:type IV pilus assembly protein PilM